MPDLCRQTCLTRLLLLLLLPCTRSWQHAVCELQAHLTILAAGSQTAALARKLMLLPARSDNTYTRTVAYSAH
jgi:hypothetical protein